MCHCYPGGQEVAGWAVSCEGLESGCPTLPSARVPTCCLGPPALCLGWEGRLRTSQVTPCPAPPCRATARAGLRVHGDRAGEQLHGLQNAKYEGWYMALRARADPARAPRPGSTSAKSTSAGGCPAATTPPSRACASSSSTTPPFMARRAAARGLGPEPR